MRASEAEPHRGRDHATFSRGLDLPRSDYGEVRLRLLRAARRPQQRIARITRETPTLPLARQLLPRVVMTLEKYLRRDLVLLPSTASAQAGARALEESGVGSILVCDDGMLVGIVTGRDIAVRVAGRGLNPARTPLLDVMSRDVATLSPGASAGEAARLMLERRVRRIPLTEGEAPVGIVTLEDLMLDQELSASMVAAILREQQAEATESRLASGIWTVPPSTALPAVA